LGAQQLLLLAGVFAVALSLLAMHQLSLNHHAAEPTDIGTQASASSRHVDRHDAAAIDDDHTHLVPLTVDGHPSHNNGVCPGCNGHHAVTLTCLAALILLAVGWVLRRPAKWRGVRLPRTMTQVLRRPNLTWIRPAFTLVELSVNRT
jgi:hypothetical protein